MCSNTTSFYISNLSIVGSTGVWNHSPWIPMDDRAPASSHKGGPGGDMAASKHPCWKGTQKAHPGG
jgi:hypothetical protein